jgi:hypothetical protein
MSAERRTSRRPSLARTLAWLALLTFAFLAGRSSVPSTSSPPPPPARAGAPERAGAGRAVAGVPLSFPRTPTGAAAAVAAYERAFAAAAILRPPVLRARIEAIATPAYAQAMLAANSPGERRLAAGPIGEGLRQGTATLYAAVPIGYRLLSYSPYRARILTWGLTLLGNATTVEPAAYFGLTRTTLAWQGKRWRIARTAGGFGPTPRLATPPGPLGPYRVLELARRLKSYELAP